MAVASGDRCENSPISGLRRSTARVARRVRLWVRCPRPQVTCPQTPTESQRWRPQATAVATGRWPTSARRSRRRRSPPACLCAVGQGILTSADGGATWQAQNSGAFTELRDGVALSSSNLWAVDQGGTLLHSTDGATWTEQASPLRWSQQLNAVSFLDANDGWAVGATDTTVAAAEPPSGVIFHTTDGGTTWTPQSSVLGGELSGVQFADANDGWAISDEPFGFGSGADAALERTTDGGGDWVAEYVPNNPSLTGLSFTDDTAIRYWYRRSGRKVDVLLHIRSSNGKSI